MTGAELLALARHSRGSSEGDADTAMHLATALVLIYRTLTPEHRHAISSVLHSMLAFPVSVDQPEYDQGITPWTR